MFLIHFSAIPQTIFLLVWFGLRNDVSLSQFLFRFMVCGIITAVCFYFVPAMGAAGSEPLAWNVGPAVDLLALRGGERTTFTWKATEEIVTFPSFHAIWAIPLIFALPTPPMIVLNVLMIISTVTTGGHYAIDIFGSILVCGFVVPITNRHFASLKS